MRKRILLPLLCLTIFLTDVNAQDGSSPLITFDKEVVSVEEFKRVYEKNNSNEMANKSTVEEYLELYINFKLKVQQALAMKLDTVSSFQSELAGYRRQLAQPYFTDGGYLETLKKEAYERMKQEIKASHILISSSFRDSPEDTLKAYNRAIEAREKLLKDGDFEKVAKNYSSDPSVSKNGGNLGYFTAFYMVYPFESAAYNLEVGEISMPVRTRYGYHIIKCTDKRPFSGKITVAHILVSSDKTLGRSIDPEVKVKEIHGLVKDGQDFAEMARLYSDDKNTSPYGGQLAPFGVGRMIPAFEEVAFSLEKDGDISEPFETDFGWHIIKRIKKEELRSYESLEKDIEKSVKKDQRSSNTQSVILGKIKKQYNFSQNLKERDDYYDVIDSSYFENKWDPIAARKLKKTLFQIGDRVVNQKEFTAYLLDNMTLRGPMDIKALVNDKYGRFSTEIIYDYKEKQLEIEEPEFKFLAQEYHDGILLFNLTDQMVWSKAIKDTLGLEQFYEEHKSEFMWKERVHAVVFNNANKEIADKTRALLAEVPASDTSLQHIQRLVNEDSQLNLRVKEGKFERGDNQLIDGVKWEKGITEDVEDAGIVAFVQVLGVEEPRPRTIEESRGMITSAYQEYLEKQWVEELRSNTKVTVNQEALSKLKAAYSE